MKKIFIFIVLILTIAGISVWKINNDINTPVDANDNTNISFQIKKGATPKEIIKNLKNKDLIKNELSLYLYIKFKEAGKDILAGRFMLNKGMTGKEIIKKISDPASAQFIITIQEGLSSKDIDKKLVEFDLIKPGDFIKAIKDFDGWNYYDFLDKETLSTLEIPLEGYLYPDTYFLNPNDFQPHDLIYLCLDNFENKTKKLLPKIKNRSIHEIITMASIVEKEVFGEKDRKLVSGILWKRLENGWTLGADATIIYATNNNDISQEDLELDSAYNTRKKTGLPPGPISNPSLESIKAAMYPTESKYWFYLTTPDTGKVIYSVSNEEHNINKIKHL